MLLDFTKEEKPRDPKVSSNQVTNRPHIRTPEVHLVLFNSMKLAKESGGNNVTYITSSILHLMYTVLGPGLIKRVELLAFDTILVRQGI